MTKSSRRCPWIADTLTAKKGVSLAKFMTIILLSLLACTAIPNADAKRKLLEAHLPVVAIDPGHGGKDTGAKGPDGTLEKAVTLNLARMIARLLDADFQVVLTRNDDYGMANSDRTAAANHAKADIFISLHAGKGLTPEINRSAVYFYLPFQGSAWQIESNISPETADDEPADRWDTIQTKHQVASKKLAKQMQAELKAIRRPQAVTVRGIPMLVLEGADMPAVAVEIGNLANAGAEKQLADSQYLSTIAKAIAQAITAFLAEKAR